MEMTFTLWVICLFVPWSTTDLKYAQEGWKVFHPLLVCFIFEVTKKKLCPINFIVQMYVNEFFHRAIEKLLEDCSVPSRSTRN